MYTPLESEAGIQPIALNSNTQQMALGRIIRATDPVAGAGEFIYLLGVANTVTGLVVSYNATTFQTTILPSTANLDTPVAVAMSPNVASQYGWYQITGVATVLKTAVAVTPQQKVYISGTAGRLFVTSTSGKEILGAKGANLATISAAVSTFPVLLNRAFAQGQIT